MITEVLPIEVFLGLCMNNPRVLSAISGWNIENEFIEAAILEHFKDMGIVRVHPMQHKTLLNSVLQLLQVSPDIRRALHKQKQAELAKMRGRRGLD